VKALRKRNETGPVYQSALGGCRECHEPSIIPADRFVQKYAARTAKSVQVCAHSRRSAHPGRRWCCDCSPWKYCHSKASYCFPA